MQQAGAVEFAENRENAAGPMHILHMVIGCRRRHLGQTGNLARDAVDVVHREVHTPLLRRRQNVQHGVRRAAHRHVERHRVLEGCETADGARQHRGVVLLVIAAAEFDDLASRLQKQPRRSAWVARRLPLPGSEKPSASVRQFIELAVNIPGTRTTGRACRAFEGIDFLVGTIAVAALDHRIDEVDRNHLATPFHLAGFHRATGNKDRRDVHPHRRHQHAGGDLVAVRDADHGVGAVRIDHVFDGVGDQSREGSE
jgi:hypothetical protein